MYPRTWSRKIWLISIGRAERDTHTHVYMYIFAEQVRISKISGREERRGEEFVFIKLILILE